MALVWAAAEPCATLATMPSYIAPMLSPLCESKGWEANFAIISALSASAPMPPWLAANLPGSAVTAALTPILLADVPVKKTFNPKAAKTPLVSLANAISCGWRWKPRARRCVSTDWP